MALKDPMDVSNICLMRLSRFKYSHLHKIRPESNESSVKRSNGNMFYLFDYFDRLICNTDSDYMQYEDCFGIEQDDSHFLDTRQSLRQIASNHELNCIASQLWTIVQIHGIPEGSGDTQDAAKRPCMGDPFNYNDPNRAENALSDKPFFALVTVTINPETNAIWLKANGHEAYGQAKFLEACKQEITRRVSSVLPSGDAKGDTIYNVYLSMNYGDFSVVVRSGNMHDIYAISAEIGRKQKVEGSAASAYKFSTLTTVGLETRTVDACGGKVHPVAMAQKTILENKDQVCIVIRISASNSVITRMRDTGHDASVTVQLQRDETSKPKGIFGKYDISVRLSLDEFNTLYPLFCMYKLDLGNDVPDNVKAADDLGIVGIIRDGIVNDLIHVINERPMLTMRFEESELQNDINTGDGEFDELYKTFVSKTEKMLKEIGALADKAYKLPMQRTIFSENMRLVKDLYSTYAPMWVQQDSRLNVWLFHAMMKALVTSINESLERISTCSAIQVHEDQLKGMCSNLLDAVSISVRTIHSFMKSVQSINLQTVNSPSYEIQTSVDVEKYSVAFAQYLLDYTGQFYHKFSANENALGINRILPVITMDSSVKIVSASPLFAYSPIQDPAAGPVKEPVQFTAILIPTFECFVKAFDLLPLITHEINHSFRFIKREVRNEQVVKLIFGRLSKYVASQWLSMSSPKRNYMNVEGLQKFPADAIYKALLSVYPYTRSKFSLSFLSDNLIAFLRREVFVDNDGFAKTNAQKTVCQVTNDALGYLLKSIYEYGDLSGLDTEDYGAAIAQADDVHGILDDTAKVEIPRALYKQMWEMLGEYRKSNSTIPGVQMENPHQQPGQKRYVIPLNQLEHVLQYVSCQSNYDRLCLDIGKLLEPKGFSLRDHVICIRCGKLLSTAEALFRLALSGMKLQLDALYKQHTFCPWTFIRDVSYSITPGNEKMFQDDIEAVRDLFAQFTHMINGDDEKIVPKRGRLFDKVPYDGNYDAVLADNLTAFLAEFKGIYTKYLPGGIFDADRCLPAARAAGIASGIYATERIAQVYVQAIAGCIYHFNCVKQAVREAGEWVPVCAGYAKSVLFEEIRRNLRESLSDLKDPIILSPEFYPFISALSATEEDTVNFTATITQCFTSIGGGLVEEMVRAPIELYREVVADLGMCAAIGFDPLGYLKFFTRYFHRSHRLALDEAVDMTVERAAKVLHVLFAQRAGRDAPIEGELDGLLGSMQAYIINVFTETRTKMCDVRRKMRRGKAGWLARAEQCLDMMQEQYVNAVDAIRGGAYNGNDLLIDTVESAMSRLADAGGAVDGDHPMRLINEYFERISRLYYMLHLIRRVIPMIRRASADMQTHLYDLYASSILMDKCIVGNPDDSLCQWESRKNLSKTRSNIRIYHNSTNPYSADGTGDGVQVANRILKNTFSFILSQYYRNRLILSDAPTFDDDWVDKLTGGRRP